MDPVASSSTSRQTVSGIASGLDTASIVSSLLEIEKAPMRRLEGRKEDVEEQRKLMREFSTMLLSLRDAARSIDNRSYRGRDKSIEEELLRYKGGSTDDGVVTAEAQPGATPGSFDLVVSQLASVGREFSNTYSDTEAETALLAGQTVTFSFPEADPNDGEAPTAFTITAEGDMSLQNLKDTINRHVDNEDSVRAEIVREGLGDQMRLVITSAKSGLKNDVDVTGDFAVDSTRVQAAQNSEFTVFGGSKIERSTNVIDDAVSGITFRLHTLSKPLIEGDPDPDGDLGLGEGTGGGRESVRVDINIDVDGVAENLGKFVDAYNAIVSFIEKQVKVDEETKRNGPLGGDSILRRIQMQISGEISRAFKFNAAPSHPFAGGEVGGGIGGVGLSLGDGGKLEIDKDVLTSALEDNAVAFSEFFSGLEDPDTGNFDMGLASSFGEMLEPLVQTGDGMLAVRDRGFEIRIEGMEDSLLRFEDRIRSRETTLTAKFTQMELIVSQISTQSGYLSSLR